MECIEEVDISVHCDVEIFEWLFQYIHNPDQSPRFDASNVVSILISSDFLNMGEDLIEKCLHYVSRHLNDILALPLDFSCLNDKMVSRLAELCVASLLSTAKVRNGGKM